MKFKELDKFSSEILQNFSKTIDKVWCNREVLES